MNRNEAFKNWTEVKKSLEVTLKKIVELKDKRTELEKQKEQQSAAFMEAETAKQKALDAFVNGELDKAGVDRACENYKQSARASDNIDEILSAQSRAVQKLEREEGQLQYALRDAEKEMFRAYYEEKTQSIRQLVGDTVRRALIAGTACGKSAQLQSFFEDVFKELHFGTADIQKIQAEIFEELTKGVKAKRE